MAGLFASLAIAVSLSTAAPAAPVKQAAPGPVPAQDAPRPAFAFTDSAVDLQAGLAEGADVLILKVTGKNLPTTAPDVKDENLPARFASTVKVVRLMGTAPGEQNWLLSAQIGGLTSQGSATRYLTVSHGGGSATLPYTVNNAYGAAFSWSVSAPGHFLLVRGRDAAIPVTIQVGPVPAANVAVGQAVLHEGDSLTPLRLELCRNETGDCTPPTILEAKKVHGLFLRPRNGSAAEPGSYSGTVSLVAPEKPETVSFPVAVYISSNCLKLLGLLAIFLGVALAWLVTVGARNLISRRQLQRVVALLRERHSKLERILAKAFPPGGPDPIQTRAVLASLSLELDGADQALPPAIPPPWQGNWDDKAQFAQLVKQIDAQLDGLEVLIVQGLEPLSQLTLTEPAVQAGVTAVDAKAGQAGTSTPQALAADVRTELAKVYQKLGTSQDPASPPPSPAKLQFEIAVLGALSWLFILTVTMLVGALALLLPNKGFGRWDDFVICLLWGFGLPAAGAQLTSLTTAHVTSAFSVSRPT